MTGCLPDVIVATAIVCNARPAGAGAITGGDTVMRMRRLGTACVVLLAAGAMAAFGVSSGSATGSPVTIGASLSLSGDF